MDDIQISEGLQRLFNRALHEAEQQAIKELGKTKNMEFVDRYLQKAQSMCIDQFMRAMEEMAEKLWDTEI